MFEAGIRRRLRPFLVRYWAFPVVVLFFLGSIATFAYFHPDYRRSLWNRGVDITANAISGLCLAFVALASWFLQQEVSLWYKRRELLQKEHFEQSLKKLEEDRRAFAAAEELKRVIAKLEEEREALAVAASNAKWPPEAARVLSAYFSWLSDNHLGFDHNVEIMKSWKVAYDVDFQQTGRHAWPGAKEELVADIRSTQLS